MAEETNGEVSKSAPIDLSNLQQAPLWPTTSDFIKRYIGICFDGNLEGAGKTWTASLPKNERVVRINAGGQEVVSLFFEGNKPSYFIFEYDKKIELRLRKSSKNCVIGRSPYAKNVQSILLAINPRYLSETLVQDQIKGQAKKLIEELTSQKCSYPKSHNEELLALLLS